MSYSWIAWNSRPFLQAIFLLPSCPPCRPYLCMHGPTAGSTAAADNSRVFSREAAQAGSVVSPALIMDAAPGIPDLNPVLQSIAVL